MYPLHLHLLASCVALLDVYRVCASCALSLSLSSSSFSHWHLWTSVVLHSALTGHCHMHCSLLIWCPFLSQHFQSMESSPFSPSLILLDGMSLFGTPQWGGFLPLRTGRLCAPMTILSEFVWVAAMMSAWLSCFQDLRMATCGGECAPWGGQVVQCSRWRFTLISLVLTKRYGSCFFNTYTFFSYSLFGTLLKQGYF